MSCGIYIIKVNALKFDHIKIFSAMCNFRIYFEKKMEEYTNLYTEFYIFSEEEINGR